MAYSTVSTFCMPTVQQVFNDLFAWVRQSPRSGAPVNVVAFQYVTIGALGTVVYGYGEFNSVTPLGASGQLLAGSCNAAASNFFYVPNIGWKNEGKAGMVMADLGNQNVTLRLAADHLLFTSEPAGAGRRLYSVDERASAFIGETAGNAVLVVSYSKTKASYKK